MHQLPRLPTWQLIIGKVIFCLQLRGPCTLAPGLCSPAHPIATPLSYARSEKCTDCMHCAGSYSIVGVSGQHVLARIT